MIMTKNAYITFSIKAFSLVLGLFFYSLSSEAQCPPGSPSTTIDYTGAIVFYTVPVGVNSLNIIVRGAEGGNNTSSGVRPGLGAELSGDFSVTPGQQLKLLVGEQPTISGNGGGGGSFVTLTDNTPIIIAGGGGGSSRTTDSPQKHGQAGTAGGNGAAGGSSGGTAGSGGLSDGTSSFISGSGGGLLTDGGDGWTANSGGDAFINGGAGANVGFGIGGFGGGGNGSGFVVGGGGGGYSGGGGGGNTPGGVGGGGGSFNSGANNTALAGVWSEMVKLSLPNALWQDQRSQQCLSGD